MLSPGVFIFLAVVVVGELLSDSFTVNIEVRFALRFRGTTYAGPIGPLAMRLIFRGTDLTKFSTLSVYIMTLIKLNKRLIRKVVSFWRKRERERELNYILHR